MTRVLIVDDDQRMVRLLAVTLPDDYEVSTAWDGEEALRLAEKLTPDLVLLDVNMPARNGFEVLAQIKGSPGLQHTRVVMVTVRGDDQDRRLAEQLGADAYFVKPFSPLELLGAIRALMGER